jgi:uncharacterized protein (TIGR02453 family)
MPKTSYFSKELFQFLYDLKFNNERAWFNANKARYESLVKEPMQRFMADAGPRIVRINPAFSIPSFFRIYRDTRFAKDKTPYKTHAAAQFRHRATADDVHAPGFYFHLEPGDSFIAGGIWTPEPDMLKKVRQRIAAADPAWVAFKKSKLVLYTDDKLKRPPAGFDPESPYIEDLKLRSFMSWLPFKDKDTCAPDFMDKFIAQAKKLDPLLRFLNSALGLKG